MSHYDCIVIGAGVSGLTAAITLSRNGKKVALLEQNDYIAPLIQRFKRSGFWCEPGFHYSGGLEPDGLLSIIFKYLQIDKHIEPVALPENNFDIISLDEKEYQLPYGLKALKNYLSDNFPKSISAINAYFENLEEVNQNTGFLNFERSFDDFSKEFYKNRSLKQFLEETGAEPNLIHLLGGHGLVLYGADAYEVPMFVHASVMGSFYKSAHTLRGGSDALINGFKEQLELLDISLFLESEVHKIIVNEKRTVTGVQLTNQEQLSCDYLISTLHPQKLPEMLPLENVRPAFISRLKDLENTFAPFMAFYGSDNVPEKIAQSNYYILNSRNGDLNLAFMAANQDAEYSGKRALSVLKKADKNYFDLKDSAEYQQAKNQETGQLNQKIKEIFPVIGGDFQLLETATPKTFYQYTRTPAGCIYGTKPSIKQRPLSSATSIRGLFLAGQSIQSGVMGSMISALMAAGNILGMENLRQQVIKCR